MNEAETVAAYTGVLRHELDDVSGEFDALCETDLKAANAALKAKGLPEIAGTGRVPRALSGERWEER